MRKIEENLEISNLLLLYLKGELLGDQIKQVDKLLKSDVAIQSLFNNLQKKEYLEAQLKRHKSLDLSEKWLIHKDKIRKEKIRKQLYFFSRLAAVILIPVIIATVLLVNNKDRYNDTKSEFVAKVIPESSNAKLIDESGDIFELTKEEELQILDSSISIKVQGNTLTYADLNDSKKLQYREVMHTLVVPKGGEFFLSLSDGSKIWVNSQTTIKYPKEFIGENRMIELIEGEAYFEIAKDPKHPFIVNTQKGMVKVLGTSFNIRAYNDEEKNITTLIEGSVSLSQNYVQESEVELRPGQHGVIIDVNRKIQVEDIDTYPIVAWKDGYYIFNSNSLESIFNQLSRWYDFKVEFENNQVRDMEFRGNVNRKEGITEILDLLEKTQTVSFEYSGKIIRVKSI